MWAAWIGLACCLFAALFLGHTLWRLADVWQEREQGRHYFHWVTFEVRFDLAALHDAVENAETARPGDPAFDALRTEFEHLRDQIAEADQARELRAVALLPEMVRLLDAQAGFLDRFAPVMALPDEALQAQLTRLETEIDELNLFKKESLSDYLDRTHNQFGQNDAAFLRALMEFGMAGAAMLFCLMAVIVMDGALLLKLRQKNSQISRINDNLRAVAEASRDASLVMDGGGRIVALSHSAEKMFGLGREEAIDRPFTDLAASELPDAEMQQRIGGWLRDKAQRFREGRRLTLAGKKPDGSTFPIEVGFGILHGEDGEELLVASVSDVTDQTEREYSLMQARNEALQAERAKSRFLSAMSHEMRTPLNGVLASLDLMRETTQLNERQTELAEIIERCGDEALEQVENVLELTRLDTQDRTSVLTAPFAPAAILRELVELHSAKARLNRNTISLDSELPDGMHVEGAARLFRQVMKNLISNAVKFTSDGDIRVTLTARDSDSGTVALRAAVSDTGIGIRPEDLERIFSNFETVRESYSQFKSGSGLGLSIAKHSADLMGGRIVVDSTPGQGSEFALEVDMARVAAAAENCLMSPNENATNPEKPTRMNILVVEDNQINRRMLVDMLHAKGHTVAEAADGLEGVSLGRENRYDLILMDISMPRLDGVGATRMLRQSGESRDVPIVAVTAHAQPEHMKEFLEAGMDQVLTKPLRMNMLDQLFMDLSAANAAPEEPAPQARDETQKEDVAATMIDKDVFDGLIEMLDVDSLSGYIDQFEQDAETLLPVYLDAVEKGDFTTARAEAHRCAGGAAVIGAVEVHSVLQGMTHAADESDAQTCRGFAEKLPGLTAETMKQMRAALPAG